MHYCCVYTLSQWRARSWCGWLQQHTASGRVAMLSAGLQRLQPFVTCCNGLCRGIHTIKSVSQRQCVGQHPTLLYHSPQASAAAPRLSQPFHRQDAALCPDPAQPIALTAQASRSCGGLRPANYMPSPCLSSSKGHSIQRQQESVPADRPAPSGSTLSARSAGCQLPALGPPPSRGQRSAGCSRSVALAAHMQAAHVTAHGTMGLAWSTPRDDNLRGAKWSHPGTLIQALMMRTSPSGTPQASSLKQRSMQPIPQ